MSKELPFFKFYPSEWLLGKIAFQSVDIQGAFTVCCCTYWQQECKMKNSDIEFRIGKKRLDKLKELGFLKELDGFIHITFLDNQLTELDKLRESKKLAGIAGGIASAKRRRSKSKHVLKSAEATVKQNQPDKIKIRQDKDIIPGVLSYLNFKTGKDYKATTEKYINLIQARVSEGFSEDDFKKVIDIKFLKWSNDEKMKDFLRPETLFSNKFQSYLNETLELKKSAPVVAGYKTLTLEESDSLWGDK